MLEIYLADLKLEAQEAVLRLLGDMNWDIVPLFVLEKEEADEQNVD